MTIQYYLSGNFSKLEKIYFSLEHTLLKYDKNTNIAGIMKPMDHIYYILNGTVASSYYHKSGKIKTYTFMGKGAQFPYFFPGENDLFQSLCFSAVSDVELIAIDRNKFQEYVLTIPELNLAQYRGYIELCSLLIEQNANQMFSGGMERICKFFYVYLVNNNHMYDNTVNLSQNVIMEFVGLNRTNLTKYLNILKTKKIIKTARNKIIVLDLQKLTNYFE